MARLRSSLFVLLTSYLNLICVDGAELLWRRKAAGELGMRSCGLAGKVLPSLMPRRSSPFWLCSIHIQIHMNHSNFAGEICSSTRIVNIKILYSFLCASSMLLLVNGVGQSVGCCPRNVRVARSPGLFCRCYLGTRNAPRSTGAGNLCVISRSPMAVGTVRTPYCTYLVTSTICHLLSPCLGLLLCQDLS
jgi:hypothetical protein